MGAVQNFFLSFSAFITALFGLSSKQPIQQVTVAPVKQSTFGEYLSLDNAVQSKLDDLVEEMDGQVDYSVSNRTGKLTFLAGIDRAIPVHKTEPRGIATELIARRFLNEYGKLFGIRDQEEELELIRLDGSVVPEDLAAIPKTIKLAYFDPVRMAHVRFKQLYKGIPVYGSQIIVHIKADGGVLYANGHIFPNVKLNTSPAISAANATQTVKTHWQNLFGVLPAYLKEPILYILNPSAIDSFQQNEPKLVWQIEVEDYREGDTPKHEFIFVDANTGEFVTQITGIFTALNRVIYDCQGYFNCPLWPYYPARSEGDERSGNNDIDKFYDFLGLTHDYFLKKGRKGANGQFGTGDGKIHSIFFPSNEGKALVTNTYGVVGWSLADFLQGPHTDGWKVVITPDFFTLDVVAHEYTHIVTLNVVDKDTSLVYRDQSGALNESFSDVFAVLIDTGDWLLTKEDGSVIRDMADPKHSDFTSQPDRLFSESYHCGVEDNGGVHSNSGIPNKAAYLIAEGGEFNGCTIGQGIGREKMGNIYYRALITCIEPTANFGDAYDCLTQSAKDLYGEKSVELNVVKAALQATQMDQQPRGRQWGASCPSKCDAENNCTPGAIKEKIPACAKVTPIPTSPSPSCDTGDCYEDCLCKGGMPDECIYACSISTPTLAPTVFFTPTPTPYSPSELSIYLLDENGLNRGRDATYFIGDIINICYTIPDPGRVDIFKKVNNDVPRSLGSNPLSDSGGCFQGTLVYPEGRHEYWIKYVQAGTTEVRIAKTGINVIAVSEFSPTATPIQAVASLTPTLPVSEPTSIPTLSSTITVIPTITPVSVSTCRPMFNISITSLDGVDLGEKIPRGQDFLCKVTTDEVNYRTTCGLMLNGSWPYNICGNYPPGNPNYGYQRWEGNTVVFKCNTKCAQDTTCQRETLPIDGRYEIRGFDFSSQCGPYTDYVVKKEVKLE